MEPVLTAPLIHVVIYEHLPSQGSDSLPVKRNEKDFEKEILINQLNDVLDQPSMQHEDSAVVLNYGVHYSISLNFTTFTELITAVVDTILARSKENKVIPRVLWKTTTAIEREKLESVLMKYNATEPTPWRFHTAQVRK